MNLRPSGYEPDELPGCSTPRWVGWVWLFGSASGSLPGLSCRERSLGFGYWSGGDLLSHVLRRSTIGAAGLNGRVRDGIGCFLRAIATRPSKRSGIGERLEGRAGPHRMPGGAIWVRYGPCMGSVWLRCGVRSRSCTCLEPCPGGWHDTGVLRVVAVAGRTGGACPAGRLSSGPDPADRAISTGQLNALLRLHLRPIDVVVFHGSRGDLVSRGASRLDAFSGYPVRT